MAVQLTIQVFKGEQLVDTKTFDQALIKIGRLSTAHLKLEDPKVSRIHTVIEVGASAGDISIIDMGSSEGTLVNGAKVTKSKLAAGDKVQLGDTRLVVSLGAAPSAAAAVLGMAGQPTAPQGLPQPLLGGPGMQPSLLRPGQPGPLMPGIMPTSPQGMPGMQQMPSFESSVAEQQAARPAARISSDRLQGAAVENVPHPALPSEEPMTGDNRALELRLYWGNVLLDIRHFVLPVAVTIGEAHRKVDYFISSEGLPKDNFPLIRYQHEQYMLTFTSSMEGELDLGHGIKSLEEIRRSTSVRRDDQYKDSFQVDMPAESKGIIHYMGMTFALRFVPPPRRIQTRFMKQIDMQLLNIAGIVFSLGIAMLVAFALYPAEVSTLKENLFSQPDRFAKLILTPQDEKNKKTEDMLEKIKKKAEEKKKELEKEKPKEEKPKEQPKVPPKEKTREEKKQEVAKKFEKLLQQDDMSGSILGGGGGGSLAGTLSNVIGTMGAGSATAGLAGLGIRGAGPLTGGGVGTSKGIGGIGTMGMFGGKGGQYGNVGMGKKKEVAIEISDEMAITGGLTKEDIKKVIRKNRNQIRYCYELGLQRNKELEGRVKIQWVISAQGKVINAAVGQSDLNAPEVEQCIVAKIRGWEFPEPKGGGIVEVNYPFIFKTS